MAKSVLIYTPSLKFGGAEKALVTLANCLVDANYDVTYCYSEKGELAQELKGNIPQLDLAKPRMLSSILPLYKVLTERKPDVIVTTLVHCNIMLLLIGFIYNLFNSHKVNVIVRETTNISLRLEQMGLVKCSLFKFLIKLCYPKANTVVFPNESLKVKFKQYFSLKMDNAAVIYNSSPFNSSLLQQGKDKEISFSSDKELTLLSVGRLTKTKRIEDLLYAVAKLQHDHQIKVDIVGTGPEEDNLKRLTQRLKLTDIVNFKGFMNQPFSNYSAENTVFVLTSELEGMPNSLIEALCSGLPCISTDCDFGPNEIFTSFSINPSWLYSPGNVDALVERLQEFLSPNSKYRINYSKGYDGFSFEQYSQKYKQVIG